MTRDPLKTIWYTRCPVPTPLGVAAQNGWLGAEFSGDGITVKSLQESGTASERASHIDHSLRYSFREGGSVPAIWARAAGSDTRVIALSWVDESQAIITLPQSGIKTARDLRGRRVGLPRRAGEKIDIFRATALRNVLTILSLDGIGREAVEWVDVAADAVDRNAAPLASGARNTASHSLYAAETRALIRGDVDAIHVKGALGKEVAFLLGAHVVADIGFHPDPMVRINNGVPRPLTVDAATLRDHPEIVTRLLARVHEVDAWARTHPIDTLKAISRETGSAEQWVRAAYGDWVAEGLKIGLEPDVIAALGAFKDFLLDEGFLPDDFDVEDWIVPQPLIDARALSAARGRKVA